MSEERSLLVIIVDVSPTTWGERDMIRRLKEGKSSKGGTLPATLEDVLASIQAFAGAYATLEQGNVLVIIAATANECAVVFPRKNDLHDLFQGASEVDMSLVKQGLILGTAELVSREAAKADAAMQQQQQHDSEQKKSSADDSSSACIAAALSLALCTINRFLVSANSGGVSALVSDSAAAWHRRPDDEGVLSLMNSSSNGGASSSKQKSRAWSPRILVIQASDDRSRDYNAIMNCVFAASKQNIVMDGCFIPYGDDTSPFLEQACDRTGGVFLAPKPAAQVGGALTEVMLAVFLSPVSTRSSLNLPAASKVDFRARCFETGESVDVAFVCNQCLSIFKTKPKEYCPTCGADIASTAKRQQKEAT